MENPPFLIGNTSSIRVHFPASYVSLLLLVSRNLTAKHENHKIPPKASDLLIWSKWRKKEILGACFLGPSKKTLWKIAQPPETSANSTKNPTNTSRFGSFMLDLTIVPSFGQKNNQPFRMKCRMMPNYTMLGILQQLTSVAALIHGG